MAAPHSGDWLHTLPISACGLHLEDNAIRVAVGLRLGCETVRLMHACVVPQWTLLVNMRCHPRKTQPEYNDMLGSTT